MKLLTRKEYERLSPVKRSVYEKRVKKYYGGKRNAFVTELWITTPTSPDTIMLYDTISGSRFMSTKDFLVANETALSILAEDGNMTIDDAMYCLRKEIGL